MLERYQARAEENERGRTPAGLILTPTRELALQIHSQLEQLGGPVMRQIGVWGDTCRLSD